jgi:hypothetical protein
LTAFVMKVMWPMSSSGGHTSPSSSKGHHKLQFLDEEQHQRQHHERLAGSRQAQPYQSPECQGHLLRLLLEAH